MGCRGFVASCARKLGLSGAVSNMRDGSVQVIIEAEDMERIGLFIDDLLINSSRFYFHGRIERYTVEDASGPIKGDYSF